MKWTTLAFLLKRSLLLPSLLTAAYGHLLLLNGNLTWLLDDFLMQSPHRPTTFGSIPQDKFALLYLSALSIAVAISIAQILIPTRIRNGLRGQLEGETATSSAETSADALTELKQSLPIARRLLLRDASLRTFQASAEQLDILKNSTPEKLAQQRKIAKKIWDMCNTSWFAAPLCWTLIIFSSATTIYLALLQLFRVIEYLHSRIGV